MQFVDDSLRDNIDPDHVFRSVDAWQGETFRAVENRRTIRVAIADKHYFAKIHGGVGWREILKNLITLRLPIVSAINELNAIKHLESIGVATMTAVAGARHGWNPANVSSCVVTEELVDTLSLEEIVEQGLLSLERKRDVLPRVAATARKMHRSGMNHRDFYLCHFLLSRKENELFLIDLHRAQIRKKTPQRWIVKDLAGLLFSAMDAGLTRRDYLRFVRIYESRPLREVLADKKGFWTDVVTRATRLYVSEHGHPPCEYD